MDAFRTIGYSVSEYTESVVSVPLESSHDVGQSRIVRDGDVPCFSAYSLNKEPVSTNETVTIVDTR